ncbi:MAG TPA: DinB family protein [Gemmatimonadaceae bacterium]|nr:DinB family protein [Gemmatimonadaceae bacterium]
MLDILAENDTTSQDLLDRHIYHLAGPYRLEYALLVTFLYSQAHRRKALTQPEIDMSVASYVPDLEDELAATRRMLERYPDGRGAWRPHAKSRTLAQLASHVAALPNHGVRVLTSNEVDLAARAPQPPSDTSAELLAAFDAAAGQVRAAVAASAETELDRTWTMRAGQQVLASGSKRLMLRRVMLNHLIHHRAQLGVYYRLLDIPVPGTYGPSADEG